MSTTPTGSFDLSQKLRFRRTFTLALTVEGAVLIALAVFAVIAPMVAAVATAVIIGWIYLVAGGVRVASSLSHRGPGYVWSLLTGLAAAAAGFLLLIWPVAGVVSLTAILGAYFIVEAVVQFVLAASVWRKARRALWLVAAGAADLILGGIVFFGLAAGAVWLLGLVVAINLAFAGAALIGLALAGHQASHAAVSDPR